MLLCVATTGHEYMGWICIIPSRCELGLHAGSCCPVLWCYGRSCDPPMAGLTAAALAYRSLSVLPGPEHASCGGFAPCSQKHPVTYQP